MGYYISTATSLSPLAVGTTFDTTTILLVQKCISQAEAEVNKYISKRYDISAFQATLTAVPPLVTSLSEQLSLAYMYRYMDRGGEFPDTRPKEIRKEALANLQLIADYKLDLVNTAGSVISDMSNTAYRCMSTTDGYKDTFNEGSPIDWQVSEAKTDDLDDEDD